MNKYGLSALDMLSLLGPMFVVGPMMVWFLVIGPLVLYPLARWKALREGTLDSQLGMKVALHYFRMLGFQLLLAGAATLIFTIISRASDKGDAYRAAFGFLVPGGIVFAAHVAFLKRTNDAVITGVHRLFLGYNLLVTGLVGFVALVAACQALFAKGSMGDEGRLFIALVLVYCGAWAGIGVQYSRFVLGGPDDALPPAAMPPTATPPAASTPAGPSLPSLSAGSFPPIDPGTRGQ
jgi:hypothetical protein